MPPAAAVVGGSLLGGAISSRGASKAAKAQAAAADRASQAQLEQYYQTRDDQMPWLKTGGAALNQLAAMYGLPTYNPYGNVSELEAQLAALPSGSAPVAEPSLTYNQWLVQDPLRYGNSESYNDYMSSIGAGDIPTTYADERADILSKIAQAKAYQEQMPTGGYESFYKTPDYQFALEEGEKGINRLAAATGRLGAGSHFKDITRFNQGLASQQFNNYANRLASLAGIGQTAAQNIGGFGANAVSNANNASMQASNARASGYMNKYNTLGGAIGGLANGIAGGAFGGFGGGSSIPFGGYDANYASRYGSGF